MWSSTIRGLYLDEVDDNRVLRQVTSEAISYYAREARDTLAHAMTVQQYMAGSVSEKAARRQLKAAVDEGIAVESLSPGTKAKVYTPTGNAWLGLGAKAKS